MNLQIHRTLLRLCPSYGRKWPLGICLDFRDLNKQTIFDPVLMPRMDEVLNKVSKARYISKLDLTKGYWQVPLDLESRQKSACITCYHFLQCDLKILALRIRQNTYLVWQRALPLLRIEILLSGVQHETPMYR
jgi:hypothetical protein